MENIESLGLFYVNIWLIIQRSTTNDSYLPGKQKVGGHLITTWTRWEKEGVKKCMFLSTLRVEKLSTQEGRGGVKKWQNSVHVVVECPSYLIYAIEIL